VSQTAVALLDAVRDELGDVAALFTDDNEILRWINDGLGRADRQKQTILAVTWLAGATTVPLSGLGTGVYRIDIVRWNVGTTPEPWMFHGGSWYHPDPEGAVAAGGATLFIWTAWSELTGGGTTENSRALDTAAVYYAVHRAYRSLVGNRALYQRYSTLLGANGVSAGDLDGMAERYFADYKSAQDDVQPLAPSTYYGD
jgi:hypothetical protein